MSSLNLNFASDSENPELAIEAAATGRKGLESANVLLVDDSVMLRMGLRRSSEAVGLRNIREANNGKEAIEILMREPFDLMLLDMEMPVMSGMEVLELGIPGKSFLPNLFPFQGSITEVLCWTDSSKKQTIREPQVKA